MTLIHDPAAPPASPSGPGRHRHDEDERPGPRHARLENRPLAVPWGLLALLAGSALLYITGITISGWGNVYYAAAVQAGTQSWHALLFGASDATASITVDKPPAAIWLMALSARLLGFSPLAVLLPQALLGVATVGIVHATVRRVAPPGAALLAGAVVATTPICALVFRYDNPDALLTTLLATALYGAVRCLERGRARWAVLVGVAFGLAFLTKQMQAFVPLPGLALALLLTAPTSWLRRIGLLLVAGVSLAASSLWWVALVELTPPAARPFVGGSQTNSFLELTLGYNGLGRILGGQGNSPEKTGSIVRTFTDASALGISWLLPAALVLGAGALVVCRRDPRARVRRGLLVAALTGLVVSDLAFSLMDGIYHSYYCAAMVPFLAISVDLGAHTLWEAHSAERGAPRVRALLGLTFALTAVWSCVLLSQGPHQLLPLLPLVACTALAAIALLLLAGERPRLASAAAALGIIAALLAPAGVSILTAAKDHHGSGPIAGYASQAPDPVAPDLADLLAGTSTEWAAATQGSVPAARLQLASGRSVMPIGGFNGTDPAPGLGRFQELVREGRVRWFVGDDGEIGSWVAQHYPGRSVGGETVYDLAAAPVG
ncbi:glycosyltransferase family 39 protein [Brachybacterium halotolerans subsp. kimchii]|uniref:ArnT family glycosyltransferase n=1 Tax=Brachybacterium halotolerans TaxID=2795215 RepID=UPI001E4993F1|nr:glycosyltransferase family 39 protein [Brachybacterium halotolerans]UEJ83826.1 glycosyltransferase family 39 protein [Brachybacterium halotolerans subsp. kimchii]